MATKEELVAFAGAHGISVDPSWLKADIEAAIDDAGYDPTTLEETTMSEEGREIRDAPAEDEPTSSDARNASYTEVTPDDADELLPPGRQVEQERGAPSEAT